MKVLIAGCGYVGSVVQERLLAGGHDAWGLRRSPTSEKNVLRADVTRPDSLAGLDDEWDALVYAVSPDRREDEAYRQAYPLGLTHLRRRLPHARVLFVSSTAVYGPSAGVAIDDASPAEPDVFSGRRLLQAEELARAAPGGHVVLRCSGIYGPGRTRLVSQLVHHDLPAAAAETWTNRIHRDDVAGVLVWALSDPTRSGTFIVSDREPAQLGRIQSYLRSLSGVTEKLRDPGRTTAASGRKSRQIVAHRLQAAGYDFEYPTYREGYRAIISAMPAP